MQREKVMRINELARKQKLTGLTEAEITEQKQLREEYLREFRSSLKSMLDGTEIIEPDGTRHKLKKRDTDENNKKRV